MKTNSWKLSALASALILAGLSAHADETYNTPTNSLLIDGAISYGDGYENEEDGEDQEDREDDEDGEDREVEEDGEDQEDREDGEDQEDQEDREDEEDREDTTADIVLPTSYSVNAGRLLGSQCAQCHGTNGVSINSWDSIAGESDLEGEIFEDDEPIMTAQAHGYTSEEIILIGNWLKTLNTND